MAMTPIILVRPSLPSLTNVWFFDSTFVRLGNRTVSCEDSEMKPAFNFSSARREDRLRDWNLLEAFRQRVLPCLTAPRRGRPAHVFGGGLFLRVSFRDGQSGD
jgi:hypothetical protein